MDLYSRGVPDRVTAATSGLRGLPATDTCLLEWVGADAERKSGFRVRGDGQGRENFLYILLFPTGLMLSEGI